ncbi:MAG: AAA family ATPase [Acutalibacteraceae bacterium]
MNLKTEEILNEIKKVIIGKDDVSKKVLMAILSGGHVLLEDVPGVGKTTLALAFSKVLGISYKRIQFTSDTMPSDVTGFSIYNKATNSFEYQAGPVMTNLLLADEINRTSSKTQAALLEVMEEKNVTVDGETHALPEPFFVIATQNPVGSAGTQMLPASQLDRFMVRLEMGYPDFRSQVNILKDRHTENPLDSLKSVVNINALTQMQKEVAAVFIDNEVYEYVTRLAEATRNDEMIELGLSPRGALAVCRYAKANAFLQGRDYVVPQDVHQIFSSVCAHRMVMSRKARMAGYKAETEIAKILDSVSMPSIETTMVNIR